MAETDERMEYSRALCAIAMASGDVWQLRNKLRSMAADFRRQADEIERFLAEHEKKSAESGTDGWYETIKQEADAPRLARLASRP